MKSINSDEFFKFVSLNSGVDIKTTQDVFYGLVRTISRELKDKQTINLPDWGKFVLRIHKARKRHDVNKKIWTTIPAIAVVKFVPDYKVKKYFRDFN